ncbi:MAG: VTT domain-containing protein [Acidobacteriota bacterium]|nr:VTT domain-containing protein [Acidobacteriota bacterium]
MQRRHLWSAAMLVAAVIVGFSIYRWSGLWDAPERLQQIGGGPAAVTIILAMAAAWAFALPASIFLFITPLLFPPHWSALITTTGCALGTAVGYTVARFIGGPWVERLRGKRLYNFLHRHSSFLVLFGIRLTPSSPHGYINYAAGLARIPFFRFVFVTTAAMAIKSYVYANAVHYTVGAKSLMDALSARTMLSLSAVAVLSFAGHVIHTRYLRSKEQASKVSGEMAEARP